MQACTGGDFTTVIQSFNAGGFYESPLFNGGLVKPPLPPESFNSALAFKNVRNRGRDFAVMQSFNRGIVIVKPPESFNSAIAFKNVRNRIVSFCHANDLKRMEVVCKKTNNSVEVQDIVETIRQGLDGTNSIDEIAEIRAALTHLCNMTVNLKHQADKHRRELFVQSNACEVVAQLIQLPQCREHAGLQEEACAAVHILARPKEGKRRMIKDEMPRIMCSILEYPEYLTNSVVQMKLMGAVINLSNDDLGAKSLVREGACKRVVSVLTRRCFSTHLQIQIYGLWSIYNLARCSEAEQPLKDAGAVEVVIQALHKPVILNCYEALRKSLGALRNLTIYSGGVKKIESLGEQKFVLDLVTSLLRKKTVDETEESVLHEHAMWLLVNFTYGAESLEEIFRAGVCQLVFDELTREKFISNPKIVDPVVGIIFNMMRFPEAEEEFARLGISRLVREAVSRFSEDKEIVEWGNEVLNLMEDHQYEGDTGMHGMDMDGDDYTDDDY